MTSSAQTNTSDTHHQQQQQPEQTQQTTPPTKGRALLNKVLPDSSTLSSFRDNYAFFARCSAVGMFYGFLLGAGTPVSPIFYRTFQKDQGAQFNIIFTFTCVGFVSSSVPYGLFLDNAPTKQKIFNSYMKSNSNNEFAHSQQQQQILSSSSSSSSSRSSSSSSS